MRFVEAKRPPTRFSKKCPSYTPVRGSFLRVFHMAPPRAQLGVRGGSGGGGWRENFQFFCPGISRPEAAPFLLPPILRGRFWPRNSGTAAGGFFFLRPIFLLSCCFFFGCLRVASCRLAPLFFFQSRAWRLAPKPKRLLLHLKVCSSAFSRGAFAARVLISSRSALCGGVLSFTSLLQRGFFTVLVESLRCRRRFGPSH